jgi:RNA polymerase sigma-70 factor, ECF subfamily
MKGPGRTGSPPARRSAPPWRRVNSSLGGSDSVVVYTFPPRHTLNVGMERVGSSPHELAIPEEPAVGASVAAFEEFFRAEQRRLHEALFAITATRSEAEDIGQEAFLRVWERWDRVSGMEDPAGYLHRTAINVFRDRSRRLVLAMKRAARMAPRTNEYDAVEARSVAASVLGQLPPRQRAAIVLTEGLGYSAEEAGELLGIKGSTVRALHFQARSALNQSKETFDG